MVAKVTIRKLETSEDWRYKGCACNGKLVQMENGNYQCRKCSAEMTIAKPKYVTNTAIQFKSH